MKNLMLALLFSLTQAVTAIAAPDNPVSLTIKTEKEVTVTENGVEQIKRVPAEDIEPGQLLFFTLIYHNNSDRKATNVVFDDPVPEFTSYVDQSAYGDGAEISYSIDNGATFGAMTELKKDGGQGPAKGADVTHIRWRVESIAPQEQGVLGFQVKVD